jgi:hypothetical protein
MVKPPPISLRIRSCEVTAHARQLLTNDLAQRRTRTLAGKAFAAVSAMRDCAQPKLKSMNFSERANWESKCKLIECILLRIVRRGVE